MKYIHGLTLIALVILSAYVLTQEIVKGKPIAMNIDMKIEFVDTTDAFNIGHEQVKEFNKNGVK